MFYILQELSMLLVNQMVLLSGAGTKSQCLQKMTEVEIWSEGISPSDLKLKDFDPSTAIRVKSVWPPLRTSNWTNNSKASQNF